MKTFNQQQEEWIRTRPPHVQAVIRKTPPTTCYRLKDGHYAISSYCEHEDGSITVKIAHLEDSYAYGVEVFGIDPNDLIPCGCCEHYAENESPSRNPRRLRRLRHRRRHR